MAVPSTQSRGADSGFIRFQCLDEELLPGMVLGAGNTGSRKHTPEVLRNICVREAANLQAQSLERQSLSHYLREHSPALLTVAETTTQATTFDQRLDGTNMRSPEHEVFLSFYGRKEK